VGLTQKEINRLSPAAQRKIRDAEKNRRESRTTPARKYHNTPCDYQMPDGSVKHFDSVKECRRFAELMLLLKAGEISELECQKEYVLIPATKRPDGKTERACKYVADFVYKDITGETVVEDVKGYRDPKSAGYAKFVIKRKLMLSVFGIAVREV